MNTYQKYYFEYLNYFRRMTDYDLVKARNEAVYFPGVDVLHAPYMDAILREMRSRGIDCSVIIKYDRDGEYCGQKEIRVLLRVLNGVKTLVRFDKVNYWVFPN